MKKSLLMLLLVLILILLYFVFTKTFFDNLSKNNQSLQINIKEKIVFNVSVLEKGVVKDSNDKYNYSFERSILSLNTENNFSSVQESIYQFDHKYPVLNDKYYLLNGSFYVNGKKVFSCNESSCPFYTDKSGKYIIFLDRMSYQAGPIKKSIGLRVMRILDIEKLEYKDFPILNYKGKDLSINGIVGYLE